MRSGRPSTSSERSAKRTRLLSEVLLLGSGERKLLDYRRAHQSRKMNINPNTRRARGLRLRKKTAKARIPAMLGSSTLAQKHSGEHASGKETSTRQEPTHEPP